MEKTRGKIEASSVFACLETASVDQNVNKLQKRKEITIMWRNYKTREETIKLNFVAASCEDKHSFHCYGKRNRNGGTNYKKKKLFVVS